MSETDTSTDPDSVKWWRKLGLSTQLAILARELELRDQGYIRVNGKFIYLGTAPAEAKGD